SQLMFPRVIIRHEIQSPFFLCCDVINMVTRRKRKSIRTRFLKRLNISIVQCWRVKFPLIINTAVFVTGISVALMDDNHFRIGVLICIVAVAGYFIVWYFTAFVVGTSGIVEKNSKLESNPRELNINSPLPELAHGIIFDIPEITVTAV